MQLPDGLSYPVPEIVVSFSYRGNKVLITCRNLVNSVIVGMLRVESSQSNENDENLMQVDALG